MELAPRKVSRITLVSLYLNKYVHNDLISDLDLFCIPEAIFSSDQAALWKVLSICLSIGLSVCYTFFAMFLSLYHHEIITSDTSDVMKRSKSEVKGKGHRGQNTFASIWAFPDPNSSLNSQMAMIWCTTRFFLTSRGQKNWRFDSDLSKINLGQSQLMIKYLRFYLLTLEI